MRWALFECIGVYPGDIQDNWGTLKQLDYVSNNNGYLSILYVGRGFVFLLLLGQLSGTDHISNILRTLCDIETVHIGSGFLNAGPASSITGLRYYSEAVDGSRTMYPSGLTKIPVDLASAAPSVAINIMTKCHNKYPSL